MRPVWQVLLIVALAFPGFVSGGMTGALLAADGGLAGGATVFLWGVGGAVAAIVVGVILVSRFSASTQWTALWVALVLTVLVLVWIGGRVADQAARFPVGGVVLHAAAQTPAGTSSERVDYLTLAQGAVPVSVGGAGAALGASFEKALGSIDGNPGGFVPVQRPGPAATDTEFVYELPAPTTFDRFAVPNVLETPSPSATFTREVEIQGSATGPADGFVVLGSATLTTHRTRGQVTEITPRTRTPVRWVKLRLVGGIQVLRPETFFEFSEIIGNGTQDPPPLSTRFTGIWTGRGVRLQLAQDGALVTGCYDRGGELTGTVTGNLLRALGTTPGDRVQSAFILAVREDATLVGVRSTNGAPFGMYTGDAAGAGAAPLCPPPPPAVLGCGAVIHGISFDFDSATIRADSDPVLAKLYEGLRDDPRGTIVIEGHTSSEGTDEYNRGLSERRAQAVAADLVRRGIAGGRLTAVGVGEARPLATNNDESGRSLNRRVEIHCR